MRKFFHWLGAIGVTAGLAILGYQNHILGISLLIIGGLVWVLTHESARAVWSNGTHNTKTVVLTAIIAILLGGTGGALLTNFVITPPKPPCGFLVSWGSQPPNNAAAIINSKEIETDRGKFRLMLICRPGDHTVDAGNDTRILKSALFDISGGLLSIEIPMPQEFISNVKKAGGGVEFHVAEVPQSVEPEQIVNIYTLERLGGKILESEGTRMRFEHPTEPQVQ